MAKDGIEISYYSKSFPKDYKFQVCITTPGTEDQTQASMHARQAL